MAPLFDTYGKQLASEGGLAEDPAARAATATEKTAASQSVLDYLRRLEAADGWRGVNRALLHGLLFAAWAVTSGLLPPAAAPADEFSLGSDWRLSTGASFVTCHVFFRAVWQDGAAGQRQSAFRIGPQPVVRSM